MAAGAPLDEPEGGQHAEEKEHAPTDHGALLMRGELFLQVPNSDGGPIHGRRISGLGLLCPDAPMGQRVSGLGDSVDRDPQPAGAEQTESSQNNDRSHEFDSIDTAHPGHDCERRG